MERTRCRLATGLIGVDPHFVGLLAQADSNQAWLHYFVQGAANGCREIGFDPPLKRQLPGNDILVDPGQLATFDHVAAGNRTIGLDNAGKTVDKSCLVALGANFRHSPRLGR